MDDPIDRRARVAERRDDAEVARQEVQRRALRRIGRAEVDRDAVSAVVCHQAVREHRATAARLADEQHDGGPALGAELGELCSQIGERLALDLRIVRIERTEQIGVKAGDARCGLGHDAHGVGAGAASSHAGGLAQQAARLPCHLLGRAEPIGG
jgi:hypothetical protein